MDKARYAAAGVDIDAGNRMVELIKPLVRGTARAGADAEIGGFGGLFDLKAAGFTDPVLVAATDGVGTKVKIAIETGRHDTIGIDLVAMSVNDLVVQGAEPLFFLDYFACGKLDPAVGAAVVAGVAAACREVRCALIGGETAEMPGLYQPGDYDLAGFAVGAVGRAGLLPRTDIAAGDIVIGLTSSGVHSNGFSLVRRIVAASRACIGCARAVRAVAQSGRGAADADAALCAIVPRRDRERRRRSKRSPTSPAEVLSTTFRACCRTDCAVALDLNRVPVLPVFKWLAAAGNDRRSGDAAHLQLRHRHGRRAGRSAADAAIEQFAANGETVVRLGEVVEDSGGDAASISAGDSIWPGEGMAENAPPNTPQQKTRRSADFRPRLEHGGADRGGEGAGLSGRNRSCCLQPCRTRLDWRARAQAGIATAIVDHRPFGEDREAFERALDAQLQAYRIDLVCLAGFMRLLTPPFVSRWSGRMLNIHPALLPEFKGLHTHRRALAAGVKRHGATVHFVVPEMDSRTDRGAGSVPVLEGDTEESARARGCWRSSTAFIRRRYAWWRKAGRHSFFPATRAEKQNSAKQNPQTQIRGL